MCVQKICLESVYEDLFDRPEHVDAIDLFAAISAVWIEISLQQMTVQLTKGGFVSLRRDRKRQSRANRRPESSQKSGYYMLVLRLRPHCFEVLRSYTRSSRIDYSAFTTKVTHGLALSNRPVNLRSTRWEQQYEKGHPELYFFGSALSYEARFTSDCYNFVRYKHLKLQL